MTTMFDPGIDDNPDEIELAMDRFRGTISAGTCPMCGQLLARQDTIDGWIYARPCGHRLGLAQPDVDADFGWSEPAYD